MDAKSSATHDADWSGTMSRIQYNNKCGIDKIVVTCEGWSDIDFLPYIRNAISRRIQNLSARIFLQQKLIKASKLTSSARCILIIPVIDSELVSYETSAVIFVTWFNEVNTVVFHLFHCDILLSYNIICR